VWRHLVRREPLRYEPTLWSMVFPLGMYAVGSAEYGQATGLGFMVDIARVELWVAVAAWAGVLVAMIRSLLPHRAVPTGADTDARDPLPASDRSPR